MNFVYSKKYFDDNYEYRQVIVSSEISKMLIEKGVMSEDQWRELGISMSKGWQNYTVYRLEPQVMLFRRPIGTDGNTGMIDPELKLRLVAQCTMDRKKVPTRFK